MAQCLSDDLCRTVVINSISIAEELREYENITVLVTGGQMECNGSFYDTITVEMINRLRFDKCFVTSACISAPFGMSIQKSRNVGLIYAVLNNSKVKVGLYPAEKIGLDSIISICPAEKLDYLITDWEAYKEDLKKFDQVGIKVVVVERE